MIPLHKLGAFDPKTAAWVGGRLLGQPWRTFAESLRFAVSSLALLPHAYIRTSDLIPEQAERADALRFEMIDARPSGHDAMLTQPGLIADHLESVRGRLVDRAETQ